MLTQIAALNLSPGDVTRATLENMQVSRAVDDIRLQLLSVGQALGLMQGSTCTLGMARCIWLELLNDRLPKETAMTGCIAARAEQCLKSPLFAASAATAVRLPRDPEQTALAMGPWWHFSILHLPCPISQSPWIMSNLSAKVPPRK